MNQQPVGFSFIDSLGMSSLIALLILYFIIRKLLK